MIYQNDLILRAARNTTPEMPIISLPEREYELIMTQVLNKISEQFAPAFFAQERCVGGGGGGGGGKWGKDAHLNPHFLTAGTR